MGAWLPESEWHLWAVLAVIMSTNTYSVCLGYFRITSYIPPHADTSLCIFLDTSVYFTQGKWSLDTSRHLCILPRSTPDTCTSALGHSGYFQSLVIRSGTHQCNTSMALESVHVQFMFQAHVWSLTLAYSETAWVCCTGRPNRLLNFLAFIALSLI